MFENCASDRSFTRPASISSATWSIAWSIDQRGSKPSCVLRAPEARAVVARVLERRLHQLDLGVPDAGDDPLRQLEDRHVLGAEVEDAGGATALEMGQDGRRDVAHVQQRAVLAAAEHLQLADQLRAGDEQVHHEVQADARVGVAHAGERGQAQDQAVRAVLHQHPLAVDLGLGVQGERLERAVLVELVALSAVHRAGRGEDDPPVEDGAEPFDRLEVDLAGEHRGRAPRRGLPRARRARRPRRPTRDAARSLSRSSTSPATNGTSFR